MPTWLITGCSTGLGRFLARAALQRDHDVVVTARDVAKVADIADGHPGALCLPLDVTNPAEVADVVGQAEARFGGIDVLVNNAGYGYRAAVEEADEADVQSLFATNFGGTVAMIKAVLPGMRSRRSGTIVNLSSISGRLALPGSAYYSATKFAVEGMSDGLRKEVGPLGIRVVVVEPGAFRTDFAGRSLQQSAARIADYDATAGVRRTDPLDGRQAGDPARAAQAILDAAASPEPPFRLLLGSDALDIARVELQAQLRELEAYAAISASTDFTAGA